MYYTLSTNHIHLSQPTSQLLERRMKTLSRHLPKRLQQEPIHMTIKESLAHNYVEGSVILHLPGKTLIAKYRAQTIKEVVTELIDRMRLQVVNYKSTHDRWHSDYPDKRTLRKTPVETLDV
jgi:ribosome-associated translation inhibitor RaiA